MEFSCGYWSNHGKNKKVAGGRAGGKFSKSAMDQTKIKNKINLLPRAREKLHPRAGTDRPRVFKATP